MFILTGKTNSTYKQQPHKEMDNQIIKEHITRALSAITAIEPILTEINSESIKGIIKAAHDAVNDLPSTFSKEQLERMQGTIYGEKNADKHLPELQRNYPKFWACWAIIELSNLLISPETNIQYHTGRTERMVRFAQNNYN